MKPNIWDKIKLRKWRLDSNVVVKLLTCREKDTQWMIKVYTKDLIKDWPKDKGMDKYKSEVVVVADRGTHYLVYFEYRQARNYRWIDKDLTLPYYDL